MYWDYRLRWEKEGTGEINKRSSGSDVFWNNVLNIIDIVYYIANRGQWIEMDKFSVILLWPINTITRVLKSINMDGKVSNVWITKLFYVGFESKTVKHVNGQKLPGSVCVVWNNEKIWKGGKLYGSSVNC